MRRMLLAAAVVALAPGVTVPTAHTATTAIPVTTPVNFRGDSLHLDRSTGKLNLDGNAVIVHGTQTIYAERITIDYHSEPKTIERIQANGNVRLVEPGRRGRAEQAVYFPQTRLLTLTGNPILWEGDDQLAGDVIRLYHEPDRVEVERARAVVAPERLRAYMGSATATPTGTTAANAAPPTAASTAEPR